MPQGLVTSILVLGQSVEAKTMEEKSRAGLKAKNEVQLPVSVDKGGRPPVLEEGL